MNLYLIIFTWFLYHFIEYSLHKIGHNSYSGYINKEKDAVDKLSKLEKINIPKDFDYTKLHSVSTEGREKLSEIKPKTIGQASRISGVSPSDINILLIYIGR